MARERSIHWRMVAQRTKHAVLYSMLLLLSLSHASVGMFDRKRPARSIRLNVGLRDTAIICHLSKPSCQDLLLGCLCSIYVRPPRGHTRISKCGWSQSLHERNCYLCGERSNCWWSLERHARIELAQAFRSSSKMPGSEA